MDQDPHAQIEDAPAEQRFARLSHAFGWAVILYLFVFALRFAQERLYGDSSYYLLRVINERWFHIEHGSWHSPSCCPWLERGQG
jgi:hypothetical protein